MKIVFHPEAYEEMLESARFYDSFRSILVLIVTQLVAKSHRKRISPQIRDAFHLVGSIDVR